MPSYLTILRAQPRPLKFLMSRLLMSSGCSTLFFIEQDGFRLRFFPSSLSAALWIDPDDRKDDAAFFRDYLRAGDTVIDAGANVGSLALLAATIVGESGRVLAVEPHPRIFGFLRHNLALNRAVNVRAENTALGEAPGELSFSDTRADDENSVQRSGSGIRVPVTTLDLLAADLGPVALLKIDVEGFEIAVLHGATGVLRRTACVYCESFEQNLQKLGWSTSDLIRKLEEAGLQVFTGINARSLRRVRPGHISVKCEDLVAMRDPEAILNRMSCAFP
jgi:FkbM family methyltransferase